MLFDLRSGRRRKVVQVVFGFLAFLFFISFVGFGIGSDVSGGIFDALGLTDNSGSSDTPETQFEAQIDEAEAKLEQDPRNEQALESLARYHYLAGQQLSVTEEGTQELTEETRAEWDEALTAWEGYLKADPKQPDPAVAAQIAQVYVALEDFGGAATAQRIVADESPDARSVGQLAYFLYADGQIEEGDAAARKAIAAAPEGQRAKLERQLDALSKEAANLQEQLKKAPAGGATGEGALDNPFGGLGGATAP